MAAYAHHLVKCQLRLFNTRHAHFRLICPKWSLGASAARRGPHALCHRFKGEADEQGATHAKP